MRSSVHERLATADKLVVQLGDAIAELLEASVLDGLVSNQGEAIFTTDRVANAVARCANALDVASGYLHAQEGTGLA